MKGGQFILALFIPDISISLFVGARIARLRGFALFYKEGGRRSLTGVCPLLEGDVSAS